MHLLIHLLCSWCNWIDLSDEIVPFASGRRTLCQGIYVCRSLLGPQILWRWWTTHCWPLSRTWALLRMQVTTERFC